MNNNKVLILDANQRSALATTRSLGNAGITVCTADETMTSLAGASRFSSNYFQYPSPSSDDFIQFIVQIIENNNVSLIIPMTELTAGILLSNKDKLKKTILPFADETTVKSIANKCSLMKTAQLLNIPFPDSTMQSPAPGNQLNEALKHKFPLILKPALSWVNYNDNWLHTSVKIADNYPAYEKILSSDPSFSACEYMIQDFIEGEGQGIFALYNHGQAVAFFNHKRIREKPPWGGVSVLSESVALNEKLVDYSRKLLDHVQWHGVAMVEFKVTADGKAYLMEVNTRFWGSLQLAIDSGVDFPYLLYQISNNIEVEPQKPYKKGIKLRWLLGDLDRLYILLKSDSYSIKEKIQSILSFFKPWCFKSRFEVNRMGDLKPFIWELKQYIRDILKI